jgi:hypothetical protein
MARPSNPPGTKYKGLARVLLFHKSQPEYNMKSLKYILLIGVLCAGMTSLAHATLTGPIPFHTTNSGIASELAGFQTVSGHTDATMCLQQATTGGTFDLIGGGTITITINAPPNAQNTVDVTFDLRGTGHVICGFLLKDGNDNNVFYYTVSADEGSFGTFTGLLVPPNGAGGFGTLSHIDVFCCPGGPGVPDGGTTVMLLGAALGSLGAARRFFFKS